jgi:RNA recognition motif-containing protein
MNIFVGNLSPEVNESDLENAFTKFGKVTSVKVIRDMFTQQSKGFGFVEMQSNTEALTAIEKLNTEQMKGKPIMVNKARPERSRKGKRR